jgi:hypothetical protein
MPGNEGLLNMLIQQMARESEAKKLIEAQEGVRVTHEPQPRYANIPGYFGPGEGWPSSAPKAERWPVSNLSKDEYDRVIDPKTGTVDYPKRSVTMAEARMPEATFRALPPAQQAPPLVFPATQPMREGPMLDGLPAEALYKSYANPADLDVVSSVPKQSIGDILALEARKMKR